MKIAIDTNILVRLTVLDDRFQLKKVFQIMETYGHKEIFIAYGVLIETYFVLRKFYGRTEKEILSFFQDILQVDQFAFEQETALRLAVSKFQNGFDFKDALIGEIGGTKNLRTLTFDKDLKNNSNFTVL